MGWSTADTITVQDLDFTNELLGTIDLETMAFLGILGRMPSREEARVSSALLVTPVEHGVAMTSRLIYLTSPEALQTAVAIGLCGVGSVFAEGSEQVAKVLQDTSWDARAQPDIQALARRVVDEHDGRKQPGIGHPLHKQIDPRTPVLFSIAEKCASSDAMSCFWRRFAPKPRPDFNVRCRSMPQGNSGHLPRGRICRSSRGGNA